MVVYCTESIVEPVPSGKYGMAVSIYNLKRFINSLSRVTRPSNFYTWLIQFRQNSTIRSYGSRKSPLNVER